MRVALLPTGEAEFRGLPSALQRLFPDHEFESVGRGRRGSAEVHHSFTSTEVDPARAALAGSKLRDLVSVAAALVSGSPRGGGYDLVFALDDLELANVAKPKRVVEAVHAAVREHLAEPRVPDTVRNSLQHGLRTRASFHFAVPMLEAWLFGDPACLRTAPEPAREVRARLAEGSDPEDFTSDDPAYETDDGSSCSLPPSWVGLDAGVRRKHPKRYLEWLCKDWLQKGCTSYRETKGGVRCLGGLDWTRLLAHPHQSQYVRAFVADLAEGLDASPMALLPGHEEAPLTCRKHARAGLLLRNL